MLPISHASKERRPKCVVISTMHMLEDTLKQPQNVYYLTKGKINTLSLHKNILFSFNFLNCMYKYKYIFNFQMQVL